MMRRLAPLLLLAACARPHARVTVVRPEVRDVREAAVEVVDGGRRPLARTRRGLVEEVARVTAGGAGAPPSVVDAFERAATTSLEARGIRTRGERSSAAAAFRLVLHDVDVRGGAAGAVAFVSATYTLLDAGGAPIWQVAQTRLPIGLGGPDLTRSQLARIATEAMRQALETLPTPPPP